MKKSNFPFELLDQNKSHLEEESDFSENEYKNNKFKIQKYEKFKPKSIMKEKNNIKTLKGAENKVRYLLSIFLKSIESEEHNSGILFKPNNTLKNKDKDSITIKKKEIKKIKTATNKKYRRSNSFNVNANNNNKINIYKNAENNKFIPGENTPKSSLFSNLIHSKKVGFNLNPINMSNINNTDSQKEGNHIYKKKSKKKNTVRTSNTLKNKKKVLDIFQRTSSNNSEYNKRNKLGSTYESPVLNSKRISTNKRGNSYKIKKNNNIRTLIKKTQSQIHNKSYLNFKNGGIMLYKNNNDTKDSKKKKR